MGLISSRTDTASACGNTSSGYQPDFSIPYMYSHCGRLLQGMKGNFRRLRARVSRLQACGIYLIFLIGTWKSSQKFVLGRYTKILFCSHKNSFMVTLPSAAFGQLKQLLPTLSDAAVPPSPDKPWRCLADDEAEVESPLPFLAPFSSPPISDPQPSPTQFHQNLQNF